MSGLCDVQITRDKCLLSSGPILGRSVCKKETWSGGNENCKRSLITLAVFMNAGHLKSSPCSGFREEFPHPVDGEHSNWVCFGCYPSGWLWEEIFKRSVEYFEEVKPSTDEPAMLICDGHYLYISNLNNVVLAREKMWSLRDCYPLDAPISSHQLVTYWPPENIFEVENRAFLWSQRRLFRHSRKYKIYGRVYLRAQTGENKFESVTARNFETVALLRPNFRKKQQPTHIHEQNTGCYFQLADDKV
jgi:hypothetical protein